ncbi:hypothetical protein C2138_07050 [Salinibacterium hongtaonis]|nr:hypothetical protein C2138_07050 [Salinibacterium hongtaonis]
MLPAPYSHRFSLADVMPSLLASVRGQDNTLRLPPTRSAIVVVADGLGSHMLKASGGHARRLAAAAGPKASIASGFPTTTASALATLTTGTLPGRHGLVGYTVLDPAHDRVVNQLSGWEGTLDPLTWQRMPTQFEVAATLSIPSFAVGAARYEDSGFTRAVLRGAEFAVGASIAERLDTARAHLAAAGGIAYVYVPELDQAGHRSGWASDRWLTALEDLDSAMARFLAAAPADEGIILTADHGMVDVPDRNHVIVDESSALREGIRHIAGEPRCLHLHWEPSLGAAQKQHIIQRWREAEESRSWVVTRDEAIGAGWFGPVDAEVAPRIGDVLIAARKGVAYYTSESAKGRGMVGQHGSLTGEETMVPLLRFGAFAL